LSAGGNSASSAHYRTVTSFLLLEARLLGARVQPPRFLPFNDFTPAAEWIAKYASEFPDTGPDDG